MVESDEAVISDVVEVFYGLKNIITTDNLYPTVLSLVEAKKAVKLLELRCSNKFITEYHSLANFLDPRYRGKIIENDEEMVVIILQTLERYARSIGLLCCDQDKDEIADSLADFRDGKKLFGCKMFSTKNPGKYWNRFKSYKSARRLAELSSRLLCIPASSTGVERNFSVQGRIHTKLRNRLGAAKIDKLTRVSWFLKNDLEKTDHPGFKNGIDDLDGMDDIEEIIIDEPFDLDKIIFD